MKVYVVLTDTGSLFTKAIKLFTKQPYNHASLAFDKNLNEVYSFGRKRPRNPFIGGFVREQMDAFIFENADCAIYSIEVTSQQCEDMRAMVQAIAAEKDRYRYNFLGVLAAAAHYDFDRDNAYFCSEFVATILQNGGFHIPKPCYFVAPHDFQDYPGLCLEYEGRLSTHLHDIEQEHWAMIAS